MSKIVPPSQPRVSPQVVERIARTLGKAYDVVLVAFRGYYRDTMGEKGKNDIGVYDDAIVLVSPNVFLAVNANTDPSIHRKGIATLVPGIHLYRKGRHGISRGPGYPALRPANAREALPVTRHGREGVFDGIAINIHKGSYHSTSSEGCQTVYPPQWDGFIKTVYSEMDRYGQKEIPYILTEAD